MLTSYISNWKKTASASIKQEEAELAFAKAASAVIESKAAPFFKDDYYLGFEIVKSFNNEFTKMVGIFVFRVNKELYYVPVFYVDGSIKCTDLLYLKDDSMFTLLSPEWCDYYVNKAELGIGNPVPNNATNKQQGQQELQLRWLAYPPFMTKGASELPERKEGYKAESPLVLFDFIKSAKDIFSKEDYKQACENLKDTSIKTASAEGKHTRLHDLIVAGGYEMFEKLASMIEGDDEFAKNMLRYYDEDQFMPKQVLDQQREKLASIKKTASETKENPYAHLENKAGKILIHKGRFNPFTNKTASEQIETGISIEDNREKKDLEALVVSPIEQFNGIKHSAGMSVYNILTTAGEIVEALIINGTSDYGKNPGLIISLKDGDKGVHYYADRNKDNNLYGLHGRQTYDVEPAGVHSQKQPWSSILADEISDKEEADKLAAKIVKDKPEAGEVFAIYDSESSYLSDEAFYIKSVKETENGGLTIIATPLYGYEDIPADKLTDPYRELTLRVNPECTKILTDMKVFTKKTKWIKIPTEKSMINEDAKEFGLKDEDAISKTKSNRILVLTPDWIPGDLNTLLRTTKELGYKNASVKYDPRNESYKIAYEGCKDNNYRCKTASVIRLMGELNYSEEDANEILKMAKDNGTQGCEFIYKTAARIILNPDPVFTEGYDADLGVRYEIPETIPLHTQELVINPPAPRYGDFNPSLTPPSPMDAIVGQKEETTIKEDENGNVFLRTASPNMLAELAKSTGKQSLFEHGLIASLAGTQDASSFISDFIPDLFQGQDKLGRILFLINLSPASFISMYGSDDIKSLENNIITVFKQQGELLLDFILKSKTTRVNTTSVENKAE